MDKEFVPVNLAIHLYELGFNEPCVKYQWNDKSSSQWMHNSAGSKTFHLQKHFKENKKIFTVSIPTFSQAFLWIRDNYGLHSFIDIYPTEEEPNRCWFMIRYMERGSKEEDYMSGFLNNHEIAELSCLRRLIEIIKTK